jgi:hypothetical protein
MYAKPFKFMDGLEYHCAQRQYRQRPQAQIPASAIILKSFSKMGTSIVSSLAKVIASHTTMIASIRRGNNPDAMRMTIQM